MFIKSFKQKSNVQHKGSEVKKLKLRIAEAFPNSLTDVSTLLSNKSVVHQIKVITHGNVATNIYTVDKTPFFFENENGKLIPTLYVLWLNPNLLPYFTTHTAVLPKLVNGADLMLPGVIRQGNGLYSYGNYKKDDLVAVNLTNNKAAVAVGYLVRSSNDLYMSGGYGICVKILHVFGDKLWGIEPSVTLQLPDFGPSINIPVDSDFPELVPTNKVKKLEEKETLDEETNIERITENMSETLISDSIEDLPNESNEESMDDILKNAFLTVIKYKGPKLVLPLLTSNFYRLHIIPAATKQIDLKQTSYKKLSKFLNEMANKGYITVREEAKGIEKISSIDLNHPDIIHFVPNDSGLEEKDQAKSNPLFHSEMVELYTVTEATFSLFSKLQLRKGDGIPPAQVKKLLKEYISKYKVPHVEGTKRLILDETLTAICMKNECTFDELHSAVLSNMRHTYEMRGKNETPSNKSPIQMSIAVRSGNKKVTLVTNLEAYGIITSEFAKACKLGAATSTTITQSPNHKGEILQIQGNQIRFLYNLLTNTYKIPPNQINGLHLATKGKKKN